MRSEVREQRSGGRDLTRNGGKRLSWSGVSNWPEGGVEFLRLSEGFDRERPKEEGP